MINLFINLLLILIGSGVYILGIFGIIAFLDPFISQFKDTTFLLWTLYGIGIFFCVALTVAYTLSVSHFGKKKFN